MSALSKYLPTTGSNNELVRFAIVLTCERFHTKYTYKNSMKTHENSAYVPMSFVNSHNNAD